MTSPSPLASPAPWDLVSTAYAEELLPVFELYARDAIDRAALTRSSRVLDVATGPGTVALLAAPLVEAVTAVDFSNAMLEIARRRVAAAGAANVRIHLADCQSLPFEDGTFDAAFSMFGLMFFPDRRAGFTELLRVLRPGGKAVVTAWTPAEDSPLLRTLFGAIREALPELPFGTGTSPLSNADDFRREMADAGFRDVEIETVSHEHSVRSMQEFWETQGRSSAPVAMLRSRMGIEEWVEFSDRVLAKLEAEGGAGPQVLEWSARLGVGVS